MSNQLTRRSFVKWGALAGGAVAGSGLVACSESEKLSDTSTPVEQVGEWKTAACPFNCSNGGAACYLRVEVVDGVPQRICTDETGEDSPINPQRRACPRGRAQISNMLSGDRVKYPMKRKGWSPDNPNGEMRGKDEWERISWDEAMDIFASETQKIIDKYGVESIFLACYDIPSLLHYYDPIMYVFNLLGGGLNNKWGTVSYGSWPLPEMFMTGGALAGPDPIASRECELQVHFGCNWASNKGGNSAYYMAMARGDKNKIVIIDPWLNQTAEGIADQWIGIRPGTDTAMILGMAYHQIANNLQNQDFLDTYCVGFDAEHMPEGAPAEDNFKDYVLGTYDGEPKTPEWASAICGVPAAVIEDLAEEIASTEKVSFFGAQSASKIPAGEMMCQAFYTLAFMHGVGTPGCSASWNGWKHSSLNIGDWCDAANIPPCPLVPAKWFACPRFDTEEDWNSHWNWLEYTEAWQSILDGAYGRDSWPCGKKPLDVHMIYSGGGENALNSNFNSNAGIKVFRKMDFVVAVNPWFCASAKYADLVLPVGCWWEKDERMHAWTGAEIYWNEKIMDLLYEARTERQIGREFAERMGVDPNLIDTASTEQRTYQSLAGSTITKNGDTKPLLTLTQDDIDAIGYSKGEPQEGFMTLSEFKDRGYIYKMERSEGDNLFPWSWSDFVADPVNNPLPTASGKFEIYCATLAAIVNSYNFTPISPIAKWQIADPEQGQGTQTEEYPLLLWTPHSLRRAHTIFDTVTSLREAFPQPCFMSTVDAEKLGIKTGDIVLMTSPYGQVIRPAKVMPTVVPGAVALEDGAWIDIDEESGIDKGGCPNILQAPKASGQGSQSYTGTLVRVEKYTGNLELEPDKKRPLVLPVGIQD